MSQTSVLSLPPKALVKLGPYTRRGGTANFVVFFDNSLGANGQNLADAVLANCEQDFAQLRNWFGGINAGPFAVYIDPGYSGAWHANCAATDLHCDAFYGTDSALVNFLNVSEADEVFMAVQNAGWNCSASNGEGLSRVLATERYPAELDGFASGAYWLDSNRPDWVSNTEPTDGDYVSIGCATLFINWLRFQLGFTLNQIVQAGGATLEETYRRLTDCTNGFQLFSALLARYFPPGQPSGLANDNPFPLAENRGRVHAVMAGIDDRVWHNEQVAVGVSAAWSDWRALSHPENMAKVLALAAHPDGRMHALMAGIDNRVWHNEQILGNVSAAWSDWRALSHPENMAKVLALAAHPDGRMHALMAGIDDRVWHNEQVAVGVSAAWSDWHPLSHPENMAKVLALAAQGAGR
jgi:hypothetical protein